MLKILRKYQLPILVVGGSLLMVVFLLQPVLQQLGPNPAEQKVGTVGLTGASVTRGDLSRAQFELEVLARYFPIAALTLVGVNPNAEDAELHWFLLRTEAERMGLIGGPADGEAWIGELASYQTGLALRQGLPPQQFEAFRENTLGLLLQNRQRAAAQTGGGTDRIDEILSMARGVNRMRVGLFETAPRLSDLAAREAARERLESAVADVLLIPAAAVENRLGEPTEDELRALVEEYGEVEPGDSEANEYGIGYRQANRVQIHWLHLSKESIASRIEPDRIEVRRRWQEENPGADPAAFAAARDDVVQRIKDEIATDLMEEYDQLIRANILQRLRAYEKEGPYYVLPEDFQGIDLIEISAEAQAELRERSGRQVPRASFRARVEDWFTPAKLTTAQGMPAGTFAAGSQAIPLGAIANMVREVGGEPQPMVVQEGIPLIDPPLRTPEGDIYYIVVRDSRRAGPPVELEEVRDRAEEDWRKIRAFEIISAEADRLRKLAARLGLDAVADEFNDDGNIDGSPSIVTLPVAEKVQVFRGGAQPAGPAARPALNANRAAVESQEFREALLEAAAAVDPLADPNSAEAQFDEDRVVVTPLPSAGGLAIGQIVQRRPVTAEQFRQQATAIASRAAQELVLEQTGDEADPFSLESLLTRFRYEPVGGRSPGAEADGGVEAEASVGG